MHRLAIAIVLVTITGCQCSRLTEHYCDAVDCIADHEPDLEHLYNPCYDLTRIGHPDWCCCRHNRLWCRHGCCAEADARKALCCGFCAQYYPPYAEEEAVTPASGETPKESGKPQPKTEPTPGKGVLPPPPAKPDYDDGMPPKPAPEKSTQQPATMPVWNIDEPAPAIPATTRAKRKTASQQLQVQAR